MVVWELGSKGDFTDRSFLEEFVFFKDWSRVWRIDDVVIQGTSWVKVLNTVKDTTISQIAK